MFGPRDQESRKRARFFYVAFDTPQSRTILRRRAGTLAISVMLMRHEGTRKSERKMDGMTQSYAIRDLAFAVGIVLATLALGAF